MRFGRALLAAFLAGPSATAPLAAQLAASDITLSLDASGVKEVVALLERGDTSPAVLDRVARLPTVRVVIAKAALYDPRATETSYEAGLKALIQRLPLPPDDPFRFQRVRDRLPQVQEMLARLERDPPTFGRDIVAMLAPYTPAGVRVDATVALVLGGTSDGWTEGGQTFYVAADMLEGDYAGAVLLAAHELYHVAQRGFMPVVRSHAAAKNVAATENLLISTGARGRRRTWPTPCG